MKEGIKKRIPEGDVRAEIDQGIEDAERSREYDREDAIEFFKNAKDVSALRDAFKAIEMSEGGVAKCELIFPSTGDALKDFSKFESGVTDRHYWEVVGAKGTLSYVDGFPGGESEFRFLPENDKGEGDVIDINDDPIEYIFDEESQRNRKDFQGLLDMTGDVKEASGFTSWKKRKVGVVFTEDGVRLKYEGSPSRWFVEGIVLDGRGKDQPVEVLGVTVEDKPNE